MNSAELLCSGCQWLAVRSSNSRFPYFLPCVSSSKSKLVAQSQCKQTFVAMIFALVPARKQPTTPAVNVLHQGLVIPQNLYLALRTHSAWSQPPTSTAWLLLSPALLLPYCVCRRHERALGMRQPSPNVFPFCCTAQRRGIQVEEAHHHHASVLPPCSSCCLDTFRTAG